MPGTRTVTALLCVLLALLLPATAFGQAGDDDPIDPGDPGDPGGNPGNPPGGDGLGGNGAHVRFDQIDLPPLLVTASEPNVTAGAMDVSAQDGLQSAEDRILYSITLGATGTGVAEHDIASVRLVHDIGLDNVADPEDTVLAEAQFDAAGEAFFDLTTGGEGLFLEFTVLHRLLVVVDASDTVVPGRTFGYGIADAHSDKKEIGTAGIAGRAITWGKEETALLTASRLLMPDVAVPVGVELQPVLGLSLHASGNDIEIASLLVRAGGTALDPVDVLDVRLVLDRNGDGTLNGLGVPGGDEELGHGVFVSDDGTLDLLAVPYTVTNGGAVELLVCVTFNVNVPAGTTLQLTAESVDVDPVVIVSGLPVAGAMATLMEEQDGGDDPVGDPFGGDLADPFADGLIASSVGCATGSGGGTTVPGLLLGAMLLVAVRRR